MGLPAHFGPLTIRPSLSLDEVDARIPRGADSVLVTTPDGMLLGALRRADLERRLPIAAGTGRSSGGADTMTITSIDVFETTLHRTNGWLKELMEELDWQDRRAAYLALAPPCMPFAIASPSRRRLSSAPSSPCSSAGSTTRAGIRRQAATGAPRGRLPGRVFRTLAAARQRR